MEGFTGTMDVDVIFLHYDSRVQSTEQQIKLVEIREVVFDTFDSSVKENRSSNSHKMELMCGRYNWYVRRLKQFIVTSGVKSLRVKHWAIKSGIRSTFMFDHYFCPDVAYTFDNQLEHWFYARVEPENNQLAMETKSRSLTRVPPIKSVLRDFENNLETRKSPVTGCNSNTNKWKPFKKNRNRRNARRGQLEVPNQQDAVKTDSRRNHYHNNHKSQEKQLLLDSGYKKSYNFCNRVYNKSLNISKNSVQRKLN